MTWNYDEWVKASGEDQALIASEYDMALSRPLAHCVCDGRMKTHRDRQTRPRRKSAGPTKRRPARPGILQEASRTKTDSYWLHNKFLTA